MWPMESSPHFLEWCPWYSTFLLAVPPSLSHPLSLLLSPTSHSDRLPLPVPLPYMLLSRESEHKHLPWIPEAVSYCPTSLTPFITSYLNDYALNFFISSSFSCFSNLEEKIISIWCIFPKTMPGNEFFSISDSVLFPDSSFILQDFMMFTLPCFWNSEKVPSLFWIWTICFSANIEFFQISLSLYCACLVVCPVSFWWAPCSDAPRFSRFMTSSVSW